MPRKSVKLPPKEPWFSKTQKIVAAIISCLVLTGMIWNYAAKADARYAKATIVDEMKKADAIAYAENKYTSDRLDIKIMQDRRNELDTRIYNKENELQTPATKVEVFKYKQEKQELEQAIDFKQKQMITPAPVFIK
jgi:hypothetical protein